MTEGRHPGRPSCLIRPKQNHSLQFNGSERCLCCYPCGSTGRVVSFSGNRRREPERYCLPSSATKQSAELSYLVLPALSGLK